MYLMLVVVGLIVGLVGAFVHHMRLYVAGIPVPYGLALALLSGATLTAAAGLLTARRMGAAAVAVPWLLSVLPFATQRPEGDLIISATPLGYAYLLGTAVLGAGAVTLPYGELTRRWGRREGGRPQGEAGPAGDVPGAEAAGHA
jgi:hypothetical protein